MAEPSNIVKFPKEKIASTATIQSQEDLLKQITDYKTSFANDLSEILSNHIFGELARCGVDFDNQIDDLFYSMVLVTESIQSLHLKAAGVYHPLQEFAEEAYSDSDDEVSGDDAEILIDNEDSLVYDGISTPDIGDK
jgi:hypothetical protein